MCRGKCIVWTGTKTRKYGSFRPTTRQQDQKAYAHRWIYEQTIGPIPEGLEIDHVRERGHVGPLCVNVDHMELVTHTENMRRVRMDVCARGHDLTDPANARWDERGYRRGCIVCYRDNARERARKRYRRATM